MNKCEKGIEKGIEKGSRRREKLAEKSWPEEERMATADAGCVRLVFTLPL